MEVYDIAQRVTKILLDRGWSKEDISTITQIYFYKKINPCLFIQVIVNQNSKSEFLSVGIYNDTGIGRNRITQRFIKTFTSTHIKQSILNLELLLPNIIEDVFVEFIRRILQK